MKQLPIIVFLLIALTALCSSICSYRSAAYQIDQDINRALQLTLAQKSSNVISADTIRCYHSHITIAEVRDTAGIAIRTTRKGNRKETQLVAEANCTFATVWRLSDQKASSTLLFIGLLWLMGSYLYIRRTQPKLVSQGLAYGGLVYNDGQITTQSGTSIHLTPMQFTLLEMFLKSESHSLTKQEICERLWPKKPDANDTLYTLIRRTKPIIEAHSNLKIESDRGRSYHLTFK